VRDVTVSWGDGSSAQDLGVINGSQAVSHVFPEADESKTYTVSGTVTDSLDNVNTVSTAVSVVPVAPPTVIITVQSTSGTGSAPATVTFELQVTTPSGVTAQSVKVNWGDTQTQDLGGLSGSVTLTHLYSTSGAYTVTVTATDSLGRSTTGTTTVTLS
jgi:hypothetical protein